jgi:imidazolonepropionase-like amidohydrolase
MHTMIQRGIYYVPTLYVFSRPTALYGGQWGKLQQVTFRNALSAGAKIAFGSDVGPFPHGQQAIEFEYMVKFGMKPGTAIRAATVVAAELMGWQDQVGSIDKGKFADIIAVQGNPLQDITELERVKFVMKGGVVVRDDFVSARSK